VIIRLVSLLLGTLVVLPAAASAQQIDPATTLTWSLHIDGANGQLDLTNTVTGAELLAADADVVTAWNTKIAAVFTDAAAGTLDAQAAQRARRSGAKATRMLNLRRHIRAAGTGELELLLHLVTGDEDTWVGYGGTIAEDPTKGRSVATVGTIAATTSDTAGSGSFVYADAMWHPSTPPLGAFVPENLDGMLRRTGTPGVSLYTAAAVFGLPDSTGTRSRIVDPVLTMRGCCDMNGCLLPVLSDDDPAISTVIGAGDFLFDLADGTTGGPYSGPPADVAQAVWALADDGVGVAIAESGLRFVPDGLGEMDVRGPAGTALGHPQEVIVATASIIDNNQSVPGASPTLIVALSRGAWMTDLAGLSHYRWNPLQMLVIRPITGTTDYRAVELANVAGTVSASSWDATPEVLDVQIAAMLSKAGIDGSFLGVVSGASTNVWPQ